MRWIVVSPYLPHPDIGHGGGTAVMQLCLELASQHQTLLLCFERENEKGRADWLRERGVDVRTLPWRSDKAQGLDRLGLIADRARVLLGQQLHDRPFMVEKYDRESLRRGLDEILDEAPCDVVQVEYSFLSPLARHALAHPSRPTVLLNTHEIASLPRERELARARDPFSRLRATTALRRAVAHEKTLRACADRVLCVTDQDRERLTATLGSADGLATVPLGFDLEGIGPAHTEESKPPRLLFVGSFGHPPNLYGARILVDEIMPLVHEIRPQIGLDIVGRGADAHLHDIATRSAGRVRVHGFVEDLDPLFARCSVFLAPLFSGGGIKIKVLEAMARGACVLSTAIGVEGIDDEGTATVLAASAEDFATKILELTSDVVQRRQYGSAAQAHIREGYAWPSIVTRLQEQVLEVRDQSSAGRQSGSDRTGP